MTKRYLSVQEISILTGFSRQFFYGEIYKAKVFGSGIPFHKLGPRVVRFNPEEVMTWLENRDHDYKSLKDAVDMRRANGTLDLQISERVKNRSKKAKTNKGRAKL